MVVASQVFTLADAGSIPVRVAFRIVLYTELHNTVLLIGHKMKKILASLLVLIGLVGCGQSGPSSEETFVTTLRNEYPVETEEYSDEELVHIGKQTCEVLDVVSLEEFAENLIDSSVNPRLAGTIIGLAIRDFCPRHTAELEEFIKDRALDRDA